MPTTYRTRDILTTRIGDQVKVEILAADDTTLPNYGTVSPWEAEDGTPGAYWSVASGQSGTAETERKAVHAAARAIRAHHKRHALEAEAASAARVEAERTRSYQQLDPGECAAHVGPGDLPGVVGCSPPQRDRWDAVLRGGAGVRRG